MPTPHATWVEVSTSNLKHNIGQLRQLVGSEVLLCPTVKANAYGHDLTIAAQAFMEAGANWLSVHSIEAAEVLRSSGISVPLYVFGYVTKDQLNKVVDLDCRVVVYDIDRLDRLEELARKSNKTVQVHLKIETGINRQGVSPEEALDIARHIKTLKHVELEGVCSHFANIEDTSDHSYAQRQIQIFTDAIDSLEQEGFTIPIRHIANSAATLLYPETYFSMVRTGIATYGMWPAEITRQAAGERGIDITLKPALTWKSVVAQVKDVPEGELVGYGCTYKTPKAMQVAIVPVGYYEGFDRAAGSAGYTLIKGNRCKIIGRVCMNNIMVDASHLGGLRAEEEVVLLGSQGPETISAEEFAGWSNRINYQATTCISTGIDNSIPRIAM